MQEKALIRKSQEDIKAFGELYDQHYARIFNYVLRRTASIESAQDITSEVFFKALKNLKRFRWRGIPFSSWLYRIASNEVASYWLSSKAARIGRITERSWRNHAERFKIAPSSMEIASVQGSSTGPRSRSNVVFAITFRATPDGGDGGRYADACLRNQQGL
jgi:RNA polymerase sigma factor (sigma-70 family)